MRRSLGKGLSHLITERLEAGVTTAPLSSLVPNKRQPRLQFTDDGLAELAESIKVHGVLQPLLVRPVGPDRYEIIAGERRFRAARLAGLTSVPIVSRASDSRESLEMALVENLQREDIGPLECANAYRQLADEFGLTQEQIAEQVGKSRVAVANTLRILRLPAEVLEALRDGSITEGHARALLAFKSPAAQIAVLQRILKSGLSVREVEAITSPTEPKAVRPAVTPDPNWEALEESIAHRVGSPVSLRRRKAGGGEMVVSFFSDEDLERILSSLGLIQ